MPTIATRLKKLECRIPSPEDRVTIICWAIDEDTNLPDMFIVVGGGAFSGQCYPNNFEYLDAVNKTHKQVYGCPMPIIEEWKGLPNGYNSEST